MQINIIKEPRYNNFPDSIKILQEFSGVFGSAFLRVVDSDGEDMGAGDHILIEGELEDIHKWLHENQPVCVGTSPSPQMEQFAQWTDDTYTPPKQEYAQQELVHFHIKSKNPTVPNSARKKKKRKYKS